MSKLIAKLIFGFCHFFNSFPGLQNPDYGVEICDFKCFPVCRKTLEALPQPKTLICATSSDRKQFREMDRGRAIPLFLELRQVKRSLKEHLIKELSSLGLELNNDTFDYMAKWGMIILFLDGYDEVRVDFRIQVSLINRFFSILKNRRCRRDIGSFIVKTSMLRQCFNQNHRRL